MQQFLWLIEPHTLQRMQAAMALAAHGNALDARLQWEAAEAAEDTRRAEAMELPRGMIVAGSSAEIRVEGVLTKRPDYYGRAYGGGNTTYANIRAALDRARSDPSIKEVVFHVDSPGGSVDGFFDTLDAIAAFRANSGKKLRTRVENAFSAAYGVAAEAGNIEAVGPGAGVGSIGVATSAFVLGPMIGKVVDITNTDSPDKRPDLSTPEGQAVVRRHLDQLGELFFKAIARGRGVDINVVKESYGRGASMTAAEAKRLGMIDKIATTQAPRAVRSKPRKTAMDDEQTATDRAAIDAAVQRGITTERDRVLAHLTMGESCGDMSIALEAIRSGASLTQELNARYLSAGMNRADRQKRQVESNAAESVLTSTAAATPNASAPDLGDQVVATLKRKESFVRA